MPINYSNKNAQILVSLVVLFCIAVIAWVRLNTLTDNFGNFDIAGIVYNAEIILDGKLPYKDTAEVKSPFLFFLFALIFKLFGTSLIYVRLVWGVWHLVTCILLIEIGRRLGALASGACAAVLLSIYGSVFGINYTTWIILPATFAIYCYVRADQRENFWWYFVCGIATSISFLVKKPGGIIIFVFIILIILSLIQRKNGSHYKDAVKKVCFLALGSFAALLPLFGLYAFQGAFWDLVYGLFPERVISGVFFAKAVDSKDFLILSNSVKGLPQIFGLFPLAAIMATIPIVLMLVRRSFFDKYGQIAVIWFIISYASVAVTGGRFYNHHTILYLPSLAMLAAHPKGLKEIIADILKLRQNLFKFALIGIIVLACVCPLSKVLYDIATGRRHFYIQFPPPVGVSETQKYVGEYIRKNTCEEDTIIAWGWMAWPIYHWSGRYSPSTVYKEMGILTDVNTNTSWTKSSPMHFFPSPVADKYLEDVKKKKPAFIIISNWYPRISDPPNEPLYEFKGLLDYIKQNYKVDKKMFDFIIYKRIGHLSENP